MGKDIFYPLKLRVLSTLQLFITDKLAKKAAEVKPLQFQVITGIVSALFLLFAIMQLIMGGYVSGFLFLIGAIFFLPPIQFEIKERMDTPIYMSTAIATGLVLTLLGFFFTDKPGEQDQTNQTMITHNLETQDMDRGDATETEYSLDNDSVQLDSEQSKQPPNTADSNTRVEITTQQSQDPEITTPPVSSDPTRNAQAPVNPSPAQPVIAATPAKTAAPVSTPLPLKTLTPSPGNTPAIMEVLTAENAQAANELYSQLNDFLRIGQSMKADRQSNNPAAQAACNESMNNALADAQATKRETDAFMEKIAGINPNKYSHLRKAATDMTSCVTCDRSGAEKACQRADEALKAYARL